MMAGSEIPALIPVAVVAAIVIVGFAVLFIEDVDKVQVLEEHRAALTMATRIVENVVLPQQALPAIVTMPSAEYNVCIVVHDLDRNIKWNSSCNKEYSTVVSMPCLVGNITNNATYTAMASVKVVKIR